MTPELYLQMLRDLKTGDDRAKRHASHRLSLLDAIGYEMPEGYGQQAAPAPFVVPASRFLEPRGWKNCLYSSDFAQGCCHAPATVYCHWQRERVQYATCDQCIKEMT